ncbi:MAG: hypothetical protein QGI37_04000, partial [Verrucomicrobiota bacterium]|nr:hypothetical protein [Verrucomicrobiota bacterium]
MIGLEVFCISWQGTKADVTMGPVRLSWRHHIWTPGRIHHVRRVDEALRLDSHAEAQNEEKCP